MNIACWRLADNFKRADSRAYSTPFKGTSRFTPDVESGGDMKPLVEAKFCASIELLEQREAQLAAMTAQRDEAIEALKAIVAAMSQPVQCSEPSASAAMILQGDCTFARQTAKRAIASIEKGQGV